ncbi:hypothetical protein AOLI_G00027640 [Acnodon oligacanthus]
MPRVFSTRYSVAHFSSSPCPRITGRALGGVGDALQEQRQASVHSVFSVRRRLMVTCQLECGPLFSICSVHHAPLRRAGSEELMDGCGCPLTEGMETQFCVLLCSSSRFSTEV